MNTGVDGAGERESALDIEAPVLLGRGGNLSLAAFAPSVAASPRTGDLHITKECGDYHGLAGEFCTFVSSEYQGHRAARRIYYASAISARRSIQT